MTRGFILHWEDVTGQFMMDPTLTGLLQQLQTKMKIMRRLTMNLEKFSKVKKIRKCTCPIL